MKRRIVLVGFSATGKSTVGRLLAARLTWAFLDSDVEIVQRTGKTIREIFHGEGEDSFRSYEHTILREARRRQGIVLASGGGAVLEERLRRIMERSFFVVCLEARPETIYQRLLKDREAGTNPIAELLTRGDDPPGRIAYLKEFRQLYYTIAHWTVHTDYLTPEDVAEEVMHGWQYFARANQAKTTDRARLALRYPLGNARESDVPYDAKV